ncbi:MAG TPA: sugar phosphate isomerase/epimerase family protein [Candidatus Hydrogenedentes bacterium]|nr:sugar phosphate isomerase/epimerase family protein [Candidatus Hydrogenedentota bacterium]
MDITRRSFMMGTAAALLAAKRGYAQEATPALRLSACDWSLGAGGPGGLEIAKAVGLDGLEVSAGSPTDILDIAKEDYRQQYKDGEAKTGVVVSSVAMGFLNNAPLATDPRGPAWLEQTIDATKALDAKVILLAFFGAGDLRKHRELKADCVDVVVERLKDAAPRAAEAGVILGLENTLSAKDNMAIIERVKSDAVRVYYDIGNSTDNGYDVPAEIRMLKDQICQFHFKDGSHFLGEGRVAMDPVVEAIRAIEYKGWIVLETAMPTKDRDADFKKNAAYVRGILQMS